MNWHYLQAFNNPNPRYACHYGNVAHPNYHRCSQCPDAATCTLLEERLNLLAAAEGISGDITVDDSFWHVKACPRDGRCVDCADAVHCLQLWLWQNVTCASI